MAKPGGEPVATSLDERSEPARTSLLKRMIDLVEPRITMTPSAAEFASVQVDGDVAIAPAKRGVREELEKAKPSLVVIPHLHLIEEGRTLADILSEVRSACPAATVVAPGCGRPWRIALYAYLGVDIVDTSTLLPLLREGRTAGPDGPQPACGCHSTPLEHLLSACAEEEDRVWRAIREGTLRELVERRALAEPFLMSALRAADVSHASPGGFIEEGFPVDCTVNASSREALCRPDIQRWRRRLRERYSKPPRARILLLAPCSFKKPYGSSRTHQRIDDLIERSGLAHAVHKVVVTSPIGLVPEELDCLPPAATYDIPVIGVWDANEREMIAEELRAYLAANEYDTVMNHVSTEIPALKEMSNVTTVEEHPLSGASGESLLRALKSAGADQADGMEGKRARFLSRMDSLARFQFGAPLGLDGSRRERVPDGFRSVLAIGGKPAAHWSDSPIELLEAGAAALAAKGAHTLVIEDMKLTGDLFAPGVIDATGDFRRGDQVAVVSETPQGRIVRAAGTAAMSALDIREQKRGRAVAIRRRFG